MYWDGWRKVDPREKIVALKGIPVLFIPGNAGSFRQARTVGCSFISRLLHRDVWPRAHHRDGG